MKSNGVISKKISVIAREIDKLKQLPEITTETLQKDHFLKHGIERSLQICIEVMIDIANRILSLRGHSPATSSAEAMEIMQDLGVIQDAARYAEMIKFRNFIVHRYESIDNAILMDILINHLDDFNAFIKEIENYEKN